MSLELSYFVLGFFAGIGCLLLAPLSSRLPSPVKDLVNKKNRTWTKIENLEYTFENDHEFHQELTAKDVATIMNEVMRIHIQTKGAGIGKIHLLPGKYSITYLVKARFVKRD